MSALSARVLTALGPGITARAGPLLPALIDALTGPLAQTDEELTVPGGAHAGAPLFNARVSSHPRWLAQAAGLRIPPALSTEAARAYLLTRGVARRGTPGALLSAARAALSGTGIIRLTERVGGDPYAARLTTYAPQTPNPAAVLTAAAAEKPVGVILSLSVLPGQSWGDVTRSGMTMRDLRSVTVRQLREALPDA